MVMVVHRVVPPSRDGIVVVFNAASIASGVSVPARRIASTASSTASYTKNERCVGTSPVCAS